MFENSYDNEDSNILDEMEQFRQRKRTTVSSVLNKKKLNKYEMDDFFIVN